MPVPKPEIGLTVNHSFLWKDEAKAGQDEGVKNRPCVIVDVEEKSNEKIVTVHPITHVEPGKPTDGVEVPQATKERLGLDDKKSWIVTNEANKFKWPGTDLNTISRNDPGNFSYGSMPEKVTSKVIEQAQQHILTKQLSIVDRDTSPPKIDNPYQRSSANPEQKQDQPSNPYRRPEPQPERKPDQPTNPYKRPGIDDDTGHRH